MLKKPVNIIKLTIVGDMSGFVLDYLYATIWHRELLLELAGQ